MREPRFTAVFTVSRAVSRPFGVKLRQTTHMGATFLLGGEVSTDMVRFSLWHAHEDAASLPAVATNSYRISTYGAGTFLFSGFENMLADFVEKAKSASSAFGGVPATACFALIDTPDSLPWAIRGAAVESKFGLSSVRVVRCTTASNGDVECTTGEAAHTRVASSPQEVPLNRLRCAQSMDAQVSTTLLANPMDSRGRSNESHGI